MPFRQPKQLQRLHHSLPLFSYALHSALVMIVVRAFWCETWVSAVLAGVLLMLFFIWNVTQSMFKVA